ncbi:hypothetical protein [Patulibacter sp. SYSU D01012]|uniref:hypothetical protein n=1 Tax=Patulibacter sp. SYSU D01012 TaxID=2817381 RepID=UPI001B317FC4|nr:hypothetical protein [Patulibacter sp. SYSU D01012]
MSGAARTWRRLYGATPLHLLVHLAGFALIAWALIAVFGHYHATAGNLALWLLAGAVLNDLVALPLYVGVDRLARAAWDRVRARTGVGRAADLVPGNGHVRVPVAMSAALLLVYLPNVLGKAPVGHRLATGLPQQPDYAVRWLLITAALLLASAAVYAARLMAAAAAARRAPRP